jgi:hypothetical protein
MDLIMAGYNGNQAKHAEVVQEVLEVRFQKGNASVVGLI